MRGCQKRIIQVKNLSGGLFDEAYFILRENASVTTHSESDMVREAGRIIEENQITVKSRRRQRFRHWVPFLCGAATAASFTSLLFLLF